MKTREVRWQDWAGAGLQHLELDEGPEEIIVWAVVIGAEEDGRRFAARFRIECDGRWRVRRVEAGPLGDEHRVGLVGDGAGHWRDGAGAPRAGLGGRWKGGPRGAWPRVGLGGGGAGHWRDGTGAPRPDLDGAIDVDLPI